MAVNKRLLQGPIGGGALTPSENFKVVTWTGTGSAQTIEVGFQPDMIWYKARNQAYDHNIYDSTRGLNVFIRPNSTIAQYSASDQITGVTSTGFTLGTGNDGNQNGTTFVAWCWKANGGTTSSNTDGTNIDSTVQVNADAGFSIVQFTTPSTYNASNTVGHGLGATPDMIIMKATASADNWLVYHGSLGLNKLLNLNGNTAAATLPGGIIFSTVNDTVFNPADTSSPSYPYIAYCFKSIDGFSNFGSYEGTAASNNIVETGFEPAFLMLKNADGTGNWEIVDNKRSPNNPRNIVLEANTSGTSDDLTSYEPDIVGFLSNGFVINDDASALTGSTNFNKSGDTYIYMAFAADPDTEAPTLASSFNIETYTGTGAAQSITGTGFLPNLVWIKDRDTNFSHALTDSVRGVGNIIKSNSTDAQSTDAQTITSFDSDGFSIGTAGGSFGNNGDDYVAWTWKADDNSPTIFGGAALAMYKFEDNANDVSGEYNGTASNVTYSSSGKFNKAAEFNGSSSYVDVSYNHSNTSFSWSMWVNADSFSNSYPTVIGGMNNSTNTNNGTIWMNSTKIVIHGSTLYGEVAFSFSTSTWYHVGMVYDSAANTVKAIINGQLYTPSSTTSNTFPSQNKMRIGRVDADTTAWDGKIDQVRLYKGVVSDVGVASLYAETVSDNDNLALGGPPEYIISANANAGFSILKYESIGMSGIQIPHGLSATPNMVLIKCTSDGSTNWIVYHSSLGNSKYLTLNDGSAQDTSGNWLVPRASTIQLNQTFGNANTNGRQYIAYCFHDIAGYQKFGSYTGTGSAGHAITGLGFKPDYVMIKSATTAEDWLVFDTRRGNSIVLYPNKSDVEAAYSTFVFDSNGFTIPQWGSINASGETYIYWAIAKNVPSNTTLANSFKAVTYSGTGASQSITAGFKPDLVWIKRRNATDLHVWTDSVRGTNKQLFSNQSDAESVTDTRLTSFDTNGFTLSGSGTRVNESGGTYVAWCWKAGNTWQSNIDGTIGSTVNANTANGFSIVHYYGTQAAGATVGHGLSAVPEMIIVKRLDYAEDWVVYHSSLGNTKTLNLNTGDAEVTDAAFNNTTPTSSVFTLSNCASDSCINSNSGNYIAYCWTPISGFSKFGTYSGTGSSQTITTGFTPDFVITKKTNGTDNWRMYDSVRQNAQPFDEILYPNLNDGEDDNTTGITGTTATGFTLGTGNLSNNSGDTYIYIAFKMN